MATRKIGQSRLGRGLNSLITAPEADASDVYFECEIREISPMPGQPRRHFDDARLNELAASVAESGVIQPLVVRERASGGYELIAGERRWRAAQLAGLSTVPVVVRDVADRDAFAFALVENIQREDLNPIEEAMAYDHLLNEYGLTQQELARRVGRGRPTIANSLRLLQLSDTVRELVAEGSLSAGLARAVLSIPEEFRQSFASQAVEEGWSVRRAEREARDLSPEIPTPKKKPEAAPEAARSPQLQAVERRLREHFGTRAVIRQAPDRSGTISLSFADDAALQVLLDQLFGDAVQY